MRKEYTVFSFYSYKGGSGRTVITAHVAYELAKSGYDVLCIDGDVQAPGLRVVFRVDEKKNYFQDYLYKSDNFKFEEAIETIEVLNKKNQEKKTGKLFLLSSSQDYNKQLEEFNYRTLSVKIKNLINDFILHYGQKNELIVLIDTANGYNEVSKAVFNLAEHIFLVYRNSRQHLMGTTVMENFFLKIPINFSLISSSIPKGIDPGLMEVYDNYITKQLREPNPENDISNENLILAKLPEVNELKWDETLLFPEKKHSTDLNEKIKSDELDYLTEIGKIAKYIYNLFSE